MEKNNNLPAVEDPYEIDQKDRRILQVLVDHPDITNAALAKIVGLGVNTIGKRRNKPAFKKAYSDLMATTDDLMKRAQKMAARRLLALIKDPDKKIALEASKMALAPMMNKHSLDIKEEIVFQTRIGSQGQLMQEVIEVDSKHISDTSTKESSQGDKEDEQHDIQGKS